VPLKKGEREKMRDKYSIRESDGDKIVQKMRKQIKMLRLRRKKKIQNHVKRWSDG